MLEIIRNTIIEFCRDFICNPYKCYTEHGQHALFYTMLYNAIPEEQRFITWENKKICIVQKEYPTAGKIGKPQRQHWDVSILKSPPISLITGLGAYDYLKLFAAIEFGLNESKEHIIDDIERLCHKDANIENGFIVHLYRLSESGALFSGRDWSSKSPRILDLEHIRRLSTGKTVEIFYGLTDSTGINRSGLWNIKDGNITVLNIR